MSAPNIYRAAHKKTITASRFAWTLANGPIPYGMHVLHRCDNRECCTALRCQTIKLERRVACSGKFKE